MSGAITIHRSNIERRIDSLIYGKYEHIYCHNRHTGQTGSFWAEEALKKGWMVFGLIRKASHFNTQNIDHIYGNPLLQLRYGDLLDQQSIYNIVEEAKHPKHFVHLGGFAHVGASFQMAQMALDVNGLGTLRCLEVLRKISPRTHFIHSATSELYGDTPMPETKMDETTTMKPRSPYAVGKLAGYAATINFREAYNMFACNSISFNHDSHRRGLTYCTRKITNTLAKIKVGLATELRLGDLSPRRDFSFAGDIVQGQLAILEANEPDDYVLASGESHSIQEFLELAASKLDLDWKKYIRFDTRFVRPSEVPYLEGNFSRSKRTLDGSQRYRLMSSFR